jgi:hypothetical protein
MTVRALIRVNTPAHIYSNVTTPKERVNVPAHIYSNVTIPKERVNTPAHIYFCAGLSTFQVFPSGFEDQTTIFLLQQ